MAIKITGTGSWVPEKILTNSDLEKMVDTSDEWIRTRTGIVERHIAADDQPTSDMALRASQSALDAAGIKATDLDLIIVGTITGDRPLPSTACILQRKLGAGKIMCFDILAACSGLLYSIEIARGLLESSGKKRALVVGAEKLSSVTNWEDRNTCVLFGDGASAMILENCAEEENSLLASDMQADGTWADLLQIPCGGSEDPASRETVDTFGHKIVMEGREVFKCAVSSMVESSQNTLDKAGVKAEDVTHLVPHQANYRILRAVASRLGIPEEKVYINVNRYGNTSAASIGLCIDEMARGGILKKGDIVLMTAFGGGLTWGSILVRW